MPDFFSITGDRFQVQAGQHRLVRQRAEAEEAEREVEAEAARV